MRIFKKILSVISSIGTKNQINVWPFNRVVHFVFIFPSYALCSIRRFTKYTKNTRNQDKNFFFVPKDTVNDLWRCMKMCTFYNKLALSPTEGAKFCSGKLWGLGKGSLSWFYCKSFCIFVKSEEFCIFWHQEKDFILISSIFCIFCKTPYWTRRIWGKHEFYKALRSKSLRITILLTFWSNSSRTRLRFSSLLPLMSTSLHSSHCLLTLLFSHHGFDRSINYIDAPYAVFVNYLQHRIKIRIYKLWCKLYLVTCNIATPNPLLFIILQLRD